MKIEQLYQSGLINEIDRAFAEMLDRRLGGIDPVVGLAAVLVSRATASGDVCLDLAALARDGFQPSDSHTAIPVGISLEHWIEKLSTSSAVGVINENKPMILYGNRLYLQRYWKYENRVAQGILDRCRQMNESCHEASATDFWAGDLFPEGDPGQKQAIGGSLFQVSMLVTEGKTERLLR